MNCTTTISDLEDYLVNCHEGTNRLTEDKVGDLVGKPRRVAALSQALQRLAHQVEGLAQAHCDPERLHPATAAELRSIVSRDGRATASPTTMPLSATERVVEPPRGLRCAVRHPKPADAAQ